MKFLAYDGPLATAVRAVFDLVVLNFCFILCCIPVVTAGAAITALYAVFLNKSDERYVLARFFGAFRSNYKQATAIWGIVLAIGAVFALEFYLVFAARFPGRIAGLIGLVVFGVVFLSVATFAFALQAHYDNTLKQTLRNSLVLGTLGIITGALTLMVSFLPVFVFFFAIDYLYVVLSVWIPVGASLSAKINCWMLSILFEQFQPPAASSEESRLEDY